MSAAGVTRDSNETDQDPMTRPERRRISTERKPPSRATARTHDKRGASPAREDTGSLPEISVVAIGASAGGLEPFSRFLDAMPPDSGLAFVVIQHLDPASHSLLPELLARHTAMRVRPAVDGAMLRPNEVYVIPAGESPAIASGRLRMTRIIEEAAPLTLIDAFLRSLARDRGNRAIGVVMSGMGTDGALGLKALKEAGGLALVQDPNEAEYGDMPRHAMLAARPDYVLPVREMPAVVSRYVAHNYVKAQRRRTRPAPEAAAAQPALADFIELLRGSTGQDFSYYKEGTISRRIERRMALHGIRHRTDYLALLRATPAEAQALANDLLINVTAFFRDSEAFTFLATALTGILSQHPKELPFRVWVAGCSTGEEAYSMGMLLLEQIDATKHPLTLQIFATDIDEEALQVARAGIYPESIQTDVSPARLKRFFVHDNGHFKIRKELREIIVFSRHDVLTDPPFARLDLVSCRNLLIYLTAEAQQRVLALFHFALRNDGVLMLGSTESIGAASDLFEPADEKWRVYRRRHKQLARIAFTMPERGSSLGAATELTRAARTRLPSLPDLAQRLILETYAPAAILVNRGMAPLYYFGPTHRYLQVVAGEPSQDVLTMAREGLRPRLRELITRALRAKRRVIIRDVQFKHDGKPAKVTMEARRIQDEPDQAVLVTFIDEPAGAAEGRPVPRRGGKSGDRSEHMRLQAELADTRRELHRTIHDLRLANEELKARNEEAMSLNEEYLATNEELESSKEEQQSLNDELNIVNGQLRQSLEQQRQTSADLSNLLNSSAVATIFLDSQLRIKAFNPRMQALFSLIDVDVGRPLSDLLPKFSDPDLAADADAARSKGAASEREVRAESGAWYLRSVLPYRTESGEVQGAVVTFTDVSRLKQAEREAAGARLYAETIVDAIREPLIVLDADLKVMAANAACAEAFHLPRPVCGQALHSLAHPIFAHPQLHGLITRVRHDAHAIEHTNVEVSLHHGLYQVWQVTARIFRAPSTDQPQILLTLDDVTEETRIVRQQLQLMVDALPGTFLAIDHERRIRLGNEQVEALFGYRRDELVGKRIDMLVPPEVRQRHAEQCQAFFGDAARRQMGAALDISGVAKSGLRIPLDIGLSPMPTAEGPMVIVAIRDLRAQKQNEAQLREAKLAAERVSQAKSRFLAAASHDLRQPLQAIDLLHGVLQRRFVDTESRSVLAKIESTVSGMTALLDTLLDINRIESGGIKPDITDFPVAAVLTRAREDFAPLAAEKGLRLRVVPCSAMIRSDRRLLSMMIANLVSNAIKYTDRGRVLLGCRRHGETLRIEVHDTGIGIPSESIDAIFDEFYRVERRDDGRPGLGLGLYIVQRLAEVLDHTIDVHSERGRGSTFAVAVPLSRKAVLPAADEKSAGAIPPPAILVVEDHPTQLDTLRTLLEMEGYRVATARIEDEALAQVKGPAAVRPDVVVADYDLSGAMTGPQLIRQVRDELNAPIPAVIVTGNKSAPEHETEGDGHTLFTKPVRTDDLLAAIATLVREVRPDWQRPRQPPVTAPAAVPAAGSPVLAVVDDEPAVRGALRTMLAEDGYGVATYADAEAFLADPDRGRFAGLVVDVSLPGIDGLALQAQLRSERVDVPVIFITGSVDLPKAVQAMREGAADFLQKPVRNEALRESVARALESGRQAVESRAEQSDVASRLASLTRRERQVMEGMLRGEMTKNIAAALGISQRTAEHHRHSVMRKMGVKSLAMLVRMVAKDVD